MRKTVSILLIVQFLIYLFVPLAEAIVCHCHLTFSLRNYPVSVIVMTAVSIAIFIVALVNKRRDLWRVSRIAAALSLPLSFLNWLFYVLKSEWDPAMLFLIACSCCALVLLIIYARPFALKVTALAVSALLSMPIFFISIFLVFAMHFGSNTLVKTLYSPDGKYRAEVIDSDHGALGGATYIHVHNEEFKIDGHVFQITKPVQSVYRGGWLDCVGMEIYWADERTLVIDGEACPIED